MITIKKNHYTDILALGGVLVMAPNMLFAQEFGYITSLISVFYTVFLGPLVALLTAIAVVVFVWGMVQFMYNSDSDQGKEAGRSKMIWGIIILFVIVTLWGFVALLTEITGVKTNSDIAAPPALPALPASSSTPLT